MKDYFPHYQKALEDPIPEMKKYFQAELAYLLKLVTPESTVLDVGCGAGRNIQDLAPHVRQAVGIDVEPRMIEAAKRRLSGLKNVLLYNEDFFAFTFDLPFDLVLSTYNTLGGPVVHAFKRQAFLKKMLECTKNDGHAVATFWSDKGMEISQKYFASIGLNVLEVSDYRVTTDAGVFKRFTKDYIEELVKPLQVPYTVGMLTELFYVVDFHKP